MNSGRCPRTREYLLLSSQNKNVTKSILGLSIIALFALAGCGGDPDEPSAADRALDELQSKYDELTTERLDAPVEWASEDLENIGDWDYKVEELAFTSAADLEQALNAFGDERWEVFWIEQHEAGFLVILKRPSISYLSKLPLSQIGRLVIGGSGSEDPEP